MKFAAQRLDRMGVQFFAELNDKIAALQAQGADVIRLDVGSPDMPPPPHILAALSQSAARPNHHGYLPHNATPALRQAWAETYRRLYSVQLDPDTEIIPLMGSKEGIFHLTLGVINPGDVVLIPDPGYLTYSQSALLAGGTPVYLPLRAEDGFLPDLRSVQPEIARQAKLLWLNYPNNPTAAVASLEFFAQAVEFARVNDLLLLHDAAYNRVTFDGYQAPSVLQVPGAKEVAIEFNSLSKSHNMAGWRVGAALGNPQALQSLYRVKTNADSGHFLPVLEAAAAALNGDQDWLIERNQVYRQRRDDVLRALRAIGLDAPAPRASVYVWSPVPPGWSSARFVAELLERARVSLTPGTVFGGRGEGYVRISLTAPSERIAEAMQRISNLGGL